MLRFPGNGTPEDSQEIEVREAARLLTAIADEDHHALKLLPNGVVSF